MSTPDTQKPPKVKSILISQPKPETDKNPYAELAKKLNLKIDFRPFTHVEGVPAREFRQQKVNIAAHTAIIFNSRNAIDHFFRMCEEMRVEMPSETKYFCISESIGVYVQKYIQMRKRKVFFGNGKLEDLVPLVLKHKTEKYLIPVSDMAAQTNFTVELVKHNITVQQAVMFRTVSSDLSDLADVNYDMIVFFTPSGIKSLFENFPDFAQKQTRIAAFGPTTQKAVLDAGLRLDVEAPTPTSPGMTMAIEEYVKHLTK